jgi:hypothetical protein
LELVLDAIRVDVRISSISLNGLQIPEEGGFGTLNFQLPMNLNRSTNANITTKTPFFGYVLLVAAVLLTIQLWEGFIKPNFKR